jgi:4-amino-4-deoxy-L-arabinose transferase-like glycosyltransferase
MTGRREGTRLALDSNESLGRQTPLLANAPSTESGTPQASGTQKIKDLLAFCFAEPMIVGILLVYGLLIGLRGVESSGEVWLNDGARYLNNGAMVRDWIDSGRWFDPFNFARDNYVQFPAHSVPYHPPGYAVMLGIWFKVFGMSYASARAFIGICLGLSLLAFRKILIELGAGVGSATISCLLFGSVPQMIIWSRTCMSELPGLMFILWGTYFFLRSLGEQNIQKQRGLSTLAIIIAFCAFMCRVTTAGVLPAWYLFLLKTKGFKASLYSYYPITALLYLGHGFLWVKFASGYSKNEMRHVIRDDVFAFLNYENLSVWLRNLPEMVSPLVVVMSCLGLAVGAYSEKVLKSAWSFWTIWLSCYYLFQIFQNLPFEARYFIYALPGVVGLVTCFLESKSIPARFGLVKFGFVGIVIVLNLVQSQFFYPGLVGYNNVAKEISARREKGNVMITAFADADLIFRLRCEPSIGQLDRQIIRGDRVLAIRNPTYSKASSSILAKTNSDVYDAIKHGRVRFVVTEGPRLDGTWVNTEEEVRLCHEAMLANPTDYELISTENLHRKKATVPIYTWRFRGELLAGKSSLPIVIPTSELTIRQ